MSEGAETFVINEDLESVAFIYNCKIESDSLFEWILSFTFLVTPFPSLERVSNNVLLTESWVEMKSNISISTEKINVKGLSLLFRCSEDEEFLSWSESSADS